MTFFAISLLFTGLSTVLAQGSTSVICSTAPWTFNDHGQSPCLVAAGLRQPCTGGSSNLPPLKSINSGYTGPASAAESTSCACSSVTYSMAAACGVCQGGSYVTWRAWSQFCNSQDIGISSYPLPIPNGLAVPAWAYDNVTVSGSFIPQTAEAESESHSRPGTTTPSPLPPPPPSSTSNSETHKKTSGGAIAGGVIGGVIGVLLLAFLAIIFLRRRKSHERMMNDYTGSNDIVKSPPPMAYVPLKLYDPSDPSTYPPELGFHPNRLPSDSTTSAGMSPTANVFSPTSATSLDPFYTHTRNFSAGTTVSSSSTSNVNLPGNTSPGMHGRNISADSARTGTGVHTFPTVGRSRGLMSPPGAGYNGAPEI